MFETYSPVSSFSLTLCVSFCALDKTATFFSLDRLVSLLGDEPHQSAMSELLVASQIFVSVQLIIFVLSPSRCACLKGVGKAHTPLQTSKGLRTTCPFRSSIQANWKPNIQAAAGGIIRILNIQSSLYQGEIGSWVFLPTHSVLNQRE